MESKSNIKHLSAMLEKFEVQYPYSIWCKRAQKSKEIPNGTKSLSKSRKIEGFSKAELKDILYEKLKDHLFINIFKRHNIKHENQVIIDLSSTSTTHSEENFSIFISEIENSNENEEKNDSNKLIKPILE